MSTLQLVFMSMSTLITYYQCIATGQAPCLAASGMRGRNNVECVSIFNCSSLTRLMSNATPADPVILRNSFCGFDKITNSVLVCCPSDKCITSDGIEGTCVGLHSCPHWVTMMQARPTLATIGYIRKNICEDSEPNNVCCAPQPTPRPPSGTVGRKEPCQLTASPPDPDSNCCGLSTGDDVSRIFGGNTTGIDEYPWLALIEYRDHDKINLGCGGSLISGQYVMTAAHCVTGPTFDGLKPVSVRLGEYDKSNVGPDCVSTAGSGTDCTDDVQIIGIEKIIYHPEYNLTTRRHDIALIKLAQVVKFTDFIRPICLPTHDFTTASPSNVDLYAAGWGATESGSSSDVKLMVRLPYMTNQECQRQYGEKMKLWNGHICAGGEFGRDSCSGDSGGPLMRITEGRHELVGIVSFGLERCGLKGVPGVYTKVVQYLPWINQMIQ